MTNMREKIADALAKCDFAGADFMSWQDGAQEPLLAKADAVLAAMREPTREMCEAGYRAMMHTDFTGPQEKNCWQAMIDFASTPSLISNVEGMG